MNKRWLIAAFLCTGLAYACGGGSGGGGSGVAGTKKVTALSPAEIDKLCTYLVSVQGPSRTIDCGGGSTIMVGGGTKMQCTDALSGLPTQHPACGATVDQTEACTEALDAEPDTFWCSDSAPPAACAAVMGTDCN